MTRNFLFDFLGSAGLILLLSFGSELGRIRLRSEFSGGGAGVGEEAREDRLDDGSEQDLRATSLGESHPEDKDELEGVVECCDESARIPSIRTRNSIRNQ
jgi:hypothetical protein